MEHLIGFVLTIAFALVTACAFALALELTATRRRVVLGILTLIILLTPLLIDPDRRFSRFLVGVLAVAVGAKLFDLHLGANLGDRPGFRDVLTYLINLTSAVRRKLADEPRFPWRENAHRFTVILTARFHPTGWRKPLAIAATLVCNVVAGTLFFASIEEVLPFYERQ